ncbi:TetR family transcriptional regulator [Arthrobacter sp. Soc17.1.1.1]|uniref:TetR/AcrR family transcriptional regulator n=1 Tax=Arthrobacter sp. Soc17.1.1.1 TaxID=3121277 RepID=UPI002FE4A2EF
MIEGRAETRRAILHAARTLFLEKGYAGASVRSVASAAGVDAALPIHYFGTKEALFLEAMPSMPDYQPLLEGDPDNLGERFVRYVLEEDGHLRPLYLTLLRASDAGAVGEQLRHLHETTFVAPLETRLVGPDADLRARLAAALVGGLMYALWVVGDERLLAEGQDVIIRRYGALLQQLITPHA